MLMKRVIVDIGSSVDILYKDAFQKLGLIIIDLSLMISTLTGPPLPLQDDHPPITLGQEPRSKTLMVTFMVVGLPTAYNIILGRSTLSKLRGVVSTYHCVIKSPTIVEVGEARSDPWESSCCYLTTVTLS
ncbi:hypothetical protein B296_00037489 [Ensete ventricosum]|uniref:Uncharacterized protein n=1 Tax=Ensete ventricosum TaxID=4639 RepID=A0A426XKU8_ENSVE|nr:hypothetical protein B296_00037489 [Ensete ventricosum]